MAWQLCGHSQQGRLRAHRRPVGRLGLARGDPGPPPCSPLSRAVMRRALARHPPALAFGSRGTQYATKVATEGGPEMGKVL